MPYLTLLKRAGIVLVVVGVLDIGLMIYAVSSGVSYSSSLNVFAVVAGVFLLRGSLRAASVVRTFALFLVAGLVSFTLVAPLVLPLGLLVAQVQVNPLAVFGSVAFFVVALALFFWLISILGSPAVREARTAVGRPNRDPRVPVVLGLALALVIGAVGFGVQRSDSARRATAEARAKLGDEYSFHVSSISFRSNSEGKLVSGVVTAWKSGSVKEVPFMWRE